VAGKKPNTIDEYIADFPIATQKALESIRSTIRMTAPEAQETISYAIPTFKLNGHYLVYFAAISTISVYILYRLEVKHLRKIFLLIKPLARELFSFP